MLSSVPAAVRKLADDLMHPVALIGCHATKESLDCCEYDLAVFTAGNNRVVNVSGHTVELIHFDKPPTNYIVELGGMEILNDKYNFMLSSAAADIAKRYKKALAAAGKKSLIMSLFSQQIMGQVKHPVVAAMWLKIAAYDFIEGTLALLGNMPLPLHELEQIRQADIKGDGVEVSLECIGIERATRPAILRSIQAVMELKSKDYDRELFASKVSSLLEKSMLADCYYYAGRTAAKNLAEHDDTFHSRYVKLVGLALDLSSDAQHLERLQKKLFKAARSGLKS